MAGSAVVGQPPANSNDHAIVVAIARLAGIPDGTLDPSKGVPMPLMRPASDHYPVSYPTHAPQTVAAMSVAIFLLSLITGLRLRLRFFRKDLRWGWDDVVIIPAAVSNSCSQRYVPNADRWPVAGWCRLAISGDWHG